MKAVNEKPIIFSTPMVRAILDGRKTQTRRVIKPQPDKDDPCINYCTVEGFQAFPEVADEIWAQDKDGQNIQLKPLYKKGDHLWVRETWGSFFDDTGHIYLYYRADEGNPDKPKFFGKWKPSIFMPRAAARLFLEVKSVRMERLNDISIEDIMYEGLHFPPIPAIHNTPKPVDFDNWNEAKQHNFIQTLARHTYIADLDYKERCFGLFKELWNTLNAKRGYSWDSNPYVWVIEFERVT